MAKAVAYFEVKRASELSASPTTGTSPYRHFGLFLRRPLSSKVYHITLLSSSLSSLSLSLKRSDY